MANQTKQTIEVKVNPDQKALDVRVSGQATYIVSGALLLVACIWVYAKFLHPKITKRIKRRSR